MAQSGSDKQGGYEAGDAPRRNRAGPVAQDARALVGPAFARKGFGEPALVLHWDEIVGPEVARLARPLRLSEGAGGGTLTLKAEPGASLFLQHETRGLCERINTYLGRPAVNRLRFVHGPLAGHRRSPALPSRRGTVPAGDPALTFQGTETLREALLALAGRRRGTPD